jgi:hypothetical protein
MEDGHETELLAYYSRGEEHDRLAAGGGQLEFLRTTEIIQRRLPPAPARVADIGGGPGRYALWLAALGYQVEHRDLMPLHVRQLETERFPHVRSAAETVERTGVLSPLHPGSFCGFCHRPQQLRGELRTAGLTVAELVNVEGPALALVTRRGKTSRS